MTIKDQQRKFRAGIIERERLEKAAPALLKACKFALLTIEFREGLRNRKDLFTDDERDILRYAIRAAEGEA